MSTATDYKKAAVECWSADPCGAVASEGELGTRAYFEKLLQARHDYAPWMEASLGYGETAGRDVLDVGCGQGIDLARYAMAGANAVGVDLTPRHVMLANAHLAALRLPGGAIVSDAEALPFADRSFDRASSNGVLHHTPGIAAALRRSIASSGQGAKRGSSFITATPFITGSRRSSIAGFSTAS